MRTFLDKTASLTPEARRIICDKSTEAPHSGCYNEVMAMGSYLWQNPFGLQTNIIKTIMQNMISCLIVTNQSHDFKETRLGWL